jgi:hypothetical protein
MTGRTNREVSTEHNRGWIWPEANLPIWEINESKQSTYLFILSLGGSRFGQEFERFSVPLSWKTPAEGMGNAIFAPGAVGWRVPGLKRSGIGTPVKQHEATNDHLPVRGGSANARTVTPDGTTTNSRSSSVYMIAAAPHTGAPV